MKNTLFYAENGYPFLVENDANVQEGFIKKRMGQLIAPFS
jgi:hypothetical protein